MPKSALRLKRPGELYKLYQHDNNLLNTLQAFQQIPKKLTGIIGFEGAEKRMIKHWHVSCDLSIVGILLLHFPSVTIAEKMKTNYLIEGKTNTRRVKH